MTYEETLHYLYNQLPVFQQVGSSAYKPGLGNSEALDVFFDHCGQLSHDDGLGHVVVTTLYISPEQTEKDLHLTY